MEQMVQGAPDVGAQTPDTGAIQQPVTPATTPAQQFAANQPPPPGAQPEPQAEVETPEQFFLKADTGTVYKTAEAAAAGIAEKDRFIQRLLEERGQSQQQPPPPPQVSPQDAAQTAIADIQQGLVQEYRSDPRYKNFSAEDIEYEAALQAKVIYRSEQRATSAFQKQLQTYQQEQFVKNTPELNTPLAQEIYDNAMRGGQKFRNPQEHLNAVHAEMYRRGIPRSQPQAGFDQGVQGAIQNQPRPLFGNVQGTGMAQQQMPSHVQQAVNDAQQKGLSAEETERIKTIAMGMNVSRFNKSRGHNQ